MGGMTHGRIYENIVAEQIRCKSARKLVEKEIRGHILEQYEENLESGMDEICAMEAAVEDMGSPVETGVALDAIHRPQMSWSMLIMIGVISFFSILIQVLVGNGNPMLGSGHMLKHGIHVVLGFAMMMLVYRLDYSKIADMPKESQVLYVLFFLRQSIWGLQQVSMEHRPGFQHRLHLYPFLHSYYLQCRYTAEFFILITGQDTQAFSKAFFG